MGDYKLIGIFALLTLIMIGAFAYFGSRGDHGPVDAAKVDEAKLVQDYSPRKGSETPKVTIVEFADFQCPACGAAHPGLKKVSDEFSKDVQFVFRNFPLPIHDNAEKAAFAAAAADEQGKFWEMHDLLFENQNAWSAGNPGRAFEDYAQQLGLDLDQFKKDRTSEKIKERIRLDKGDANALEVNATPTIYINGVEFKQGASYENLKTAIEKALEVTKDSAAEAPPES